MANKTIHELTPASTISSDYEFAVYDIDGSTTKKATAEQVLKTSSLLYADDQAEPTGEVSFVSQDTMLTPAATDTLSVELLQGTDTWGARFQKISQMFRNIRYLLRTMGTTDISSIGNGTATGAINELNNKFIYETITLATNVTVPAETTTSVYTIPSKTNYTRVAVIPRIEENFWGVYSYSVNNNYIYFFNNSTASHTNTFKIDVLYMKNQ